MENTTEDDTNNDEITSDENASLSTSMDASHPGPSSIECATPIASPAFSETSAGGDSDSVTSTDIPVDKVFEHGHINAAVQEAVATVADLDMRTRLPPSVLIASAPVAVAVSAREANERAARELRDLLEARADADDAADEEEAVGTVVGDAADARARVRQLIDERTVGLMRQAGLARGWHEWRPVTAASAERRRLTMYTTDGKAVPFNMRRTTAIAWSGMKRYTEAVRSCRAAISAMMDANAAAQRNVPVVRAHRNQSPSRDRRFRTMEFVMDVWSSHIAAMQTMVCTRVMLQRVVKRAFYQQPYAPAFDFRPAAAALLPPTLAASSSAAAASMCGGRGSRVADLVAATSGGTGAAAATPFGHDQMQMAMLPVCCRQVTAVSYAAYNVSRLMRLSQSSVADDVLWSVYEAIFVVGRTLWSTIDDVGDVDADDDNRRVRINVAESTKSVTERSVAYRIAIDRQPNDAILTRTPRMFALVRYLIICSWLHKLLERTHRWLAMSPTEQAAEPHGRHAYLRMAALHDAAESVLSSSDDIRGMWTRAEANEVLVVFETVFAMAVEEWTALGERFPDLQ